MFKVLFNDNWKFVLKELGRELPEMVIESDWHDVEIPHDWLIGNPYHFYETGEGWYKKEFDIDSLDENDVYILCFDGVYMNCTVYINGEEAGTWRYGYSSFSFDISDFVAEGKNTIYVQVRHEAPNTRWYSGAGIFRNVYLRKTSKTHIVENGVYISTKKEMEKWLVTIETEISSIDCEIRHTVYNEKGNVVAVLNGRASDNKSVLRFYAENPRIWDVDNPYCYSVKTELFHENVIQDEVSNVFGFRTTEFSPEKGFLLNGRVLKIHGVCIHHDLGALGAAFNVVALKRQLEILKSFGVNSVRTSHNMPARELIELCNEMGLLVNCESFDMWELPKNKNDYARFFPEWYEKDVKAWVERDRNAPCVIMWSIGNEIFDTHTSERGLEVAQMLREAVLKYDKYENAVCTIGSNYMRWENAQKVADYLKLAGYNYAEDLYDSHHEKNPDWFIYGSETASTVRSRGIYHLPANVPILTHSDLQCSDYGNSVVGWGKFQEKAWIDDRDRDFCGGQYVWTGFDYIGEPTPYSTKNSYFGIIDTAGFPKDSFYLYKSVWVDPDKEPFVHILPYWDFNIGDDIDVYTYSNLEDVELFFNGVSLGKQYVDLSHGEVLHGCWRVKYRRGTLTARAYDKNGRVVAEDIVSSFTDPISIEAVPNKVEMLADGRDLIFIEITVKDEMGIPVANARNRIRVTVNGPARLVGLDNGDSTDYESYKSDNRRLFSGKLLAIIQSTFDIGTITVSCEGEGLSEKMLVFEAVECQKPTGVSVSENYYPYFDVSSFNDEHYTRKIELRADKAILDEESSTVLINARVYPDNSDFKEIEWKCVLDNGVEVGLSEIKPILDGAVISAKGDGKYRIRASCSNGKAHTEVFSDLVFENTGFGSALTDPYTFVSASLYNFSNHPLNIVERAAVSGITERTVIGFDNIDFGGFGSDDLLLHCGHCGGNEPVPVELWNGNPDNGGKLIETLLFENNKLWDNFAPQRFTLPERLKGISSIAFVAHEHIIVGGFEFVKKNKAYETLNPTDNDAIYGDEYTINGTAVNGIGNNVVINFADMDFSHGTNKITVCGKTPNATNTIQLRYNDDNGIQQTQLLEFPNCSELTEITFDIEELYGTKEISFVFLPGSNFDFSWFKFE